MTAEYPALTEADIAAIDAKVEQMPRLSDEALDAIAAAIDAINANLRQRRVSERLRAAAEARAAADTEPDTYLDYVDHAHTHPQAHETGA